jgi:glycosyltransferase involved in cell wall biosynthesis
MALALVKKSFNVAVLEWDRSSLLPAAEYTKGLNVYCMRLKAPYGNKLAFVLPLWWVYTFWFVLLRHFSIIQPQNLDNLLPLLVPCRLKKIKIVYDIADFYADTYISSNMILLRKFVAWLEKTLIKAVNAVIIVDEKRIEQIKLNNSPFVVIYNSPPDIYDKLKSKYPVTSSFASKFTLFYAGNLEKDRGLDTLIQAVQGLDDVELIIAGFGRIEKEISKMVKDKSNIRFLGRIPYDAVLELTFLCDCVVALYDPQVPNNLFASPNKLFEAMMCGKPIIVNSGTVVANRILQERCGLIVEYGNVNELKRGINMLKSNRDLADYLGRNGRNAYLKKYNWRLMEQRLLKLYNSMV